MDHFDWDRLTIVFTSDGGWVKAASTIQVTFNHSKIVNSLSSVIFDIPP